MTTLALQKLRIKESYGGFEITLVIQDLPQLTTEEKLELLGEALLRLENRSPRRIR